MSKKLLIIDRDGTLIQEAPPTYQIDSFSKLAFYPHVFEYMRKIAMECDYELIMVSNQDGLGTAVFPEDTFWPVQHFIIQCFENEHVHFSAMHFDKSFPAENLPTRKPGIGMFTEYIGDEKYDLQNSVVIGDRITDVQLAKNLNCKAIWINNGSMLGATEIKDSMENLRHVIALETKEWKDIYEFLKAPQRKLTHVRKTKETEISIEINLDGTGLSDIKTGLAFFDHMLEQIAKHGKIDLMIRCDGDLHIDEHHSIEDTGIALGEAFAKALGDKRGLDRYGFSLPMDDCLAQVALDFGGRSWLVWDADFKREKIGEMPTEMFHHFFKSWTDAAKANLNIKAEGENEHHKIESIFKAFAKALKMASRRDINSNDLPTTKGIL